MPKYTTIHKDPLTTNTIEPNQPKANQAKPKLKPVTKTPNSQVGFYKNTLGYVGLIQVSTYTSNPRVWELKV